EALVDLRPDLLLAGLLGHGSSVHTQPAGVPNSSLALASAATLAAAAESLLDRQPAAAERIIAVVGLDLLLVVARGVLALELGRVEGQGDRQGLVLGPKRLPLLGGIGVGERRDDGRVVALVGDRDLEGL